MARRRGGEGSLVMGPLRGGLLWEGKAPRGVVDEGDRRLGRHCEAGLLGRVNDHNVETTALNYDNKRQQWTKMSQKKTIGN